MYIEGVGNTQRVNTVEKTQAQSQPTGFAKQMALAVEMGRDLDPIFEKASKEYGVPQDLLRAIGFHESGFQAKAVSSAGAMGIMQLMPETAQTMGVTNPFDAEQNIMGGAKLLGMYAKQYEGDLKLMLAAYGAGSGAVAKYDGVPPYAETKQFIEDIMSVVDKDIMNKPQPKETVYETYPDLWSEMQGFRSYSQADYELFLDCWQRINADILDLGLGEQEDRPTSLFYLG